MPLKNAEDRKRYQREWKATRYSEDQEFRERTKATSRKYGKTHRPEINARRRRRYATDPAFRAACHVRGLKHSRAARLKARYGLTIKAFDEMVARQAGRCVICERRSARRLSVDHCHATGLVRALLCSKCNVGLGNLEDNPVFAFRAAIYLVLWLHHLFELQRQQENDMTSNDDTAHDSRAARQIRTAILKELRQPFGVAPAPPVDRLQAVARALVDKAEDRDVAAIKEPFDRAGGKTAPASAIDELAKLVKVPWKNPSSPSMAATSTRVAVQKSASFLPRVRHKRRKKSGGL
jgi:Autographiviridae endonuclease VII